MRVSDFYFELPNDLIAQYPKRKRTASRLLQLNGNTGSLRDSSFTALLDLVRQGDLMVFNNTRVMPARMFGRKKTGGKLEVLIERILNRSTVLAHVYCSKLPKISSTLFLGKNDEYEVEVIDCHSALFKLCFNNGESVLNVLNHIGHVPLPPYISRLDTAIDKERYQTVYNLKLGAVAAPTAGLHFDEVFLEKIKKKGIKFAYVTLHIGSGTFYPVKVDKINEHKMHSEYVEVKKITIDAIRSAKARGGRIIAIGTTSARSLESVAQNALKKNTDLMPFCGDTKIFIFPGYKYQLVDCLVTNFHLPKSTLIMLVSALSGYNHVMSAYQYAVKNRYRFFSYGDSMFATRKTCID
ncbi:S-adenosylmethionine:tRNA ribosyltransferase-isomerase [Candidatus Photodesmus katoptron]|uniref:S-adenosylmethionine:tRNA ribosyltransferase-isomerase n=1 Tax=Candidatus Photodesmus katoptron Akat1 TaxID=1236703 RepID=S3E184_9GAMM|nr:tRNA preQ1(34) S-adenosylmethionine ribosyltransferase-isomerase QueA [Candidatus Photodesmus katoptron]EPE37946.1 S-adenosylmethionine:tRNA, QueA [Candidatus Photodesmus katoptron Akat1]KEY90267.1 S-adenosylmethionine:tRNA ribosyltransferase-isomerase [Candidatus Photodesmus katoptron]